MMCFNIVELPYHTSRISFLSGIFCPLYLLIHYSYSLLTYICNMV